MTHPLVSVVIETVTPQTSVEGGRLADRLSGPLKALAEQSYPRNRIEPIVVVGMDVPAGERAEIARRYPSVTLLTAAAGNYFDPKNRGAAAAKGEIVTFLDGDCTPERDWLETLIARFEPGLAGVAGRVRYEGKSFLSRILSVPDFGYILTEKDGHASGINLGNVAFRRDTLLSYPLDIRLIRNGACYDLFHRLRAAGERIAYEPDAIVSHAVDFQGLSFLKKHYLRGYDGLWVYRLDDAGIFRGTAYFRRFGWAALPALSARRILVDVARIVRHRRQMGVSRLAVPVYAALGAGLRLVELAGSLAANFSRKRRDLPPVGPQA